MQLPRLLPDAHELAAHISPAHLRKQQALREEYNAEIDALQFLDAAEREAYDQWAATTDSAITSARLRSFQVF